MSWLEGTLHWFLTWLKWGYPVPVASVQLPKKIIEWNHPIVWIIKIFSSRNLRNHSEYFGRNETKLVSNRPGRRLKSREPKGNNS